MNVQHEAQEALLEHIPDACEWDITISVIDHHQLPGNTAILKRGKSKIAIYFARGEAYESVDNKYLFETMNTLVDAGFKVSAEFQFTQDSLLNFSSKNIRAQGDKVRILCEYSYIYEIQRFSLVMQIRSRVRKHYRAIRSLEQLTDINKAIERADKISKAMSATSYDNIEAPNTFVPNKYSMSTKSNFGIGPDPKLRPVVMTRLQQLMSASVLGPACLLPSGEFTFDNIQNPDNKHIWMVIYGHDTDGMQRVLAVNNSEWYELDGQKYLFISPGRTDLNIDDQLFICDCINDWTLANQS